MFSWLKKVKLESYLTNIYGSTDIREIPWVKQMMPSSVSEHTPNWFSKQKAFREKNYNLNTIKMCPSFINTFKVGHIIRNPSQIEVVGQQGENGTIFTSMFSEIGECHASWHLEDTFADNFPFPTGMIKASYKVHSPFMVRASRSTNLFILPCWWDSNYPNVAAIQGLIRISPKRDIPFNINTFIREPKVGESYIIPYGAPLAQLIVVDLPEVEYCHNQSLCVDDQAKREAAEPKHQRVQGQKRNPIDNIKEFLIKTGIKNEN